MPGAVARFVAASPATSVVIDASEEDTSDNVNIKVYGMRAADEDENHCKKERNSKFVKAVMSTGILYILDATLMLALAPIVLWQWMAANDRLAIILKRIVEVSLELTMWIVLAGVSIVITIIFVLGEFYFDKNDNDELKRRLMSIESSPKLNVGEAVVSQKLASTAEERVLI